MKSKLKKKKKLGFIDLGFAKIDTFRQSRQGFPEVIFCEKKTPSQVGSIFAKIALDESVVLATRATEDHYKAVYSKIKNAKYYPEAKCIVWNKTKLSQKTPLNKITIAILAAGTADIPVAEEAAITASCFGFNIERAYDVGVAGLHRLLAQEKLLLKAHIFIVVAGMEGALPSVVAGLVDKPLIAVPTSIGYGTSFKGIAALLGMLNSCGSGVTVVNIDNGFGAGFAAGQIARLIQNINK